MSKKRKILIVDDISHNIQIIVSIFENYCPDYILYQANEGEIAILIAQKTLPDLIITDWDMPGMNGIELIKRLKQIPETQNILIIMSSGVMTSVENLQTALDAGAIDYIKKPIDEVELVARTNSALKLAESYNKILEQKNTELLENTLLLIRNNKFNVQINEKLQQLENLLDPSYIEAKNIINEIITNIDNKIKTDSWRRFDLAFNTVYKDFYKNITTKFPDLTKQDTKICAFLKLGLNSKDIASILFISPDSVKVSRSRIRKKLGISTENDFQSFLSQF